MQANIIIMGCLAKNWDSIKSVTNISYNYYFTNATIIANVTTAKLNVIAILSNKGKCFCY